MSDRKPFVVIFILLIALLVACRPAQTEPGAGEATQLPAELPTAEIPEAGGAADMATAAARAHLARELGVAEAEIEVVSVEAAEFSDSCLGLGQAHESCLQAMTPGWLIMLDAEGQVYEVRTDETGQQVRVAG